MTHCVLIILPFFNDISKGMTHPGNKSYHIDLRWMWSSLMPWVNLNCCYQVLETPLSAFQSHPVYILKRFTILIIITWLKLGTLPWCTWFKIFLSACLQVHPGGLACGGDHNEGLHQPDAACDCRLCGPLFDFAVCPQSSSSVIRNRLHGHLHKVRMHTYHGFCSFLNYLFI